MNYRFRENTRASTGKVGGPDPGGPLSERQTAFIRLFAALLIVGLLALRVSALWDWGWEAHGLGRSIVEGLTIGRDVDIDLSIVFPFGVVTAWVLLFMIDRTKALQRWLVGVVYFSFFISIIFFEDRWIEHVDWVENWYVLVIGFIVGFLIAVVPQFSDNRRQGEFPIASIGLFLLVTGLSLVALLDVYVFHTDSITINTIVGPAPQTVLGAIIDIISVGAFIGLFGWFIFYSDYRAITVLSTSRELGIGVMAGLLNHTQKQHEGKSGTGGVLLSEAYGALSNGRPPGAQLVNKAGNQLFEIMYLSPLTPQRWVLISAAPISIDQIGPPTINRIASRVSNPSITLQAISLFSDNLFPVKIKRWLVSDTGLLIDQIVDADVMLLVTSIHDIEGYQANKNLAIDKLGTSPQIDRFIELCERIGDGRQNIIVVTNAEEALPLSNANNINDPRFVQFLKGQVLDLDNNWVNSDNDKYTVVPVSWSAQTSNDELLEGVEQLRLQLE